MAKLNWTPWMGLADVKAELERVMAQAMREGKSPCGLSEKAYFWTPAADVLDTRDAYVITVELAGVDRGNVAVEVRSRSLWVYGERRFEKGCDCEGVYVSLERSYGPFARRFALPRGVDRAGVAAVFKNGLLEITLPKIPQEPSARRIVIV
jgi:HSP20 family protein